MLSADHEEKQRGYEPYIALAAVVPFVLWILAKYLNLDFWFDEVDTLAEFCFVPLERTITFYPRPNNHIFFNLINNLYLRLIREPSLYSLMDHPFRIRLLSLAYSLLASIYLYRIGSEILDRSVGVLATVFLATTVPFYNFAVQVRGYALSMALISMLIFYSLRLESRFSLRDLLLVPILCTLCLYTIPLNLYLVASLICYKLLWAIWVHVRRPKSVRQAQHATVHSSLLRSIHERNPHALTACLLVMGCLLAFGLYTPVWAQMVSNRWIARRDEFSWETLSDTMPSVLTALLSHRYAVLALGLPGPIVYYAVRRRSAPLLPEYALAGFCTMIPFVFSHLYHDSPFERVFVNLSLMSSLFLAIGCHQFLLATIGQQSRRLVLVAAILVYCHVTFAIAVVAKDATLTRHIQIDKKDHGITLNYFQKDYGINDLARGFAVTQPTEDVPLALFEVDKVALPAYLAKYGLEDWARIVRSSDIDTIPFNDFGQVNLITSKPMEVLDALENTEPELVHTVLYRRRDFHKVLLLDRYGQARERMQPLATFQSGTRLIGLQMPERVSRLGDLDITTQWQVEGPHNVFVNYWLTRDADEVHVSSDWHRLSNDTESLPYWTGNPVTYDSWTPGGKALGKTGAYGLYAEVFVCVGEECAPERQAEGHEDGVKIGSVEFVDGGG